MISNPHCVAERRGKITSGESKGGLTSKSDLSTAASMKEGNTLHIKAVWCPRASVSRQTGSPTGLCSNPLRLSLQRFLCNRIS